MFTTVLFRITMNTKILYKDSKYDANIISLLCEIALKLIFTITLKQKYDYFKTQSMMHSKKVYSSIMGHLHDVDCVRLRYSYNVVLLRYRKLRKQLQGNEFRRAARNPWRNLVKVKPQLGEDVVVLE